jgi:hypothetical protein
MSKALKPMAARRRFNPGRAAVAALVTCCAVQITACATTAEPTPSMKANPRVVQRDLAAPERSTRTAP